MAPRQKPGNSNQDYQTPPELLRAIERDFSVDEWSLDLAANNETVISQAGFALGARVAAPFYGPGGLFEDALTVDWKTPGDLWLNPPFAHIDPWA